MHLKGQPLLVIIVAYLFVFVKTSPNFWSGSKCQQAKDMATKLEGEFVKAFKTL